MTKSSRRPYESNKVGAGYLYAITIDQNIWVSKEMAWNVDESAHAATVRRKAYPRGGVTALPQDTPLPWPPIDTVMDTNVDSGAFHVD
jgi:hypothetical protein